MFKKKVHGIFNEVPDGRRVVYDFRRRTRTLFQNYRPISYHPPAYDLKQVQKDDSELVKTLLTSHALDAANQECFLEVVLGPVRAGLLSLEKQYSQYMDFYAELEGRTEADSADIGQLIDFWEKKKAELEKEHDETRKLWNTYSGLQRRRDNYEG